MVDRLPDKTVYLDGLYDYVKPSGGIPDGLSGYQRVLSGLGLNSPFQRALFFGGVTTIGLFLVKPDFFFTSDGVARGDRPWWVAAAAVGAMGATLI